MMRLSSGFFMQLYGTTRSEEAFCWVTGLFNILHIWVIFKHVLLYYRHKRWIATVTGVAVTCMAILFHYLT
jgi:hypothetical protein